MKNWAWRTLLAALALCLLLGLGLTASAETSGTTGSCTWTFDDTTGKLTISGSGAMADYDGGSNKAPWMNESSNITTVVIENGVTSIGDTAFDGCSSLTSVTIPDSVTSIGYEAFDKGTNLKDITIPASLTGSYKGAFDEATVEHVTITGDTAIAEKAFENSTGLTSVTIGDSVKTIGASAFANCSGLKSVTIGNGVTGIDYYAFRGCTGLTSITIPDSVTSIANNAFSSCTGLKSVTIPESVTSIGASAFANCSKLKTVSIPASLTDRYKGSFDEGTVEHVTITGGTAIAYEAFKDSTGLKSVTISNSVETIGEYAFQGCTSLTSVDLGSVKTIGTYAFSGCDHLNSISFDDPTIKYVVLNDNTAISLSRS